MTTVAHALTEWLAYRSRLRALGLVAASTEANQSAIAVRLCEELGAHQLVDLRKSHVELYIGERMKTCQPITVAGELNVLRQVLNWCVDEQLLTTRPRLPTVRVTATEAALPSDEAFLWVLANVAPQHARALELMMLTGLSPHELERLQVQDESAPARLGIGMRPDFAVKTESRRRVVPLTGRALDLWREATWGMQPETAPFPRVDAMQKAIRRCFNPDPEYAPTAVPAGALAITPKLMRKWFASKVAGDHPEHVLQRLLGHAPGSPITRKHYVRSNDEQTVAAVTGLGI